MGDATYWRALAKGYKARARIAEDELAECREELAGYEEEVSVLRRRFRDIAKMIESGGGWVEQARRVALWESVPGHPDDESSGPDAELELTEEQKRNIAEQYAWPFEWEVATKLREELEQEKDRSMRFHDAFARCKHELAECREELAAAGAQLLAAKEAVDWLWGYWDGNTLIPHRHDASLQAEIQEAFEACIDATVLGDHAALDAALEQVRAEEQERWRPLVQRLLAIFQGDWPSIKAQFVEGRWTWLPVDDEARDAIVAARKAIRAEGTE